MLHGVFTLQVVRTGGLRFLGCYPREEETFADTYTHCKAKEPSIACKINEEGDTRTFAAGPLSDIVANSLRNAY